MLPEFDADLRYKTRKSSNEGPWKDAKPEVLELLNIDSEIKEAAARLTVAKLAGKTPSETRIARTFVDECESIVLKGNQRGD